jgi:Flp pilus assembly protein TadD
MAVRLLVLVIALAGAGFLAVQERGARAAERLTGAALTAEAPSEADLRLATTWNPDTQPALDFAIAAARVGRFEQAGAKIVAVTRAEPRNARAWTLLCTIAKRYDSDLAATACARARDLAPPVPRGSLNRSIGRSTT